jgi:site-specific DNA-methyltransferase (adenine-specific)
MIQKTKTGRANINFYNCDNIEFMKSKPDNYYDLLICDPEYGIKQGGDKNHTRGKLATSKKYHSFKDDKAPDAEYFDLVKRKSKNQIIWGANHFIDNMPFNLNSSCWIVWDKDNGKTDFADCELAYTSFKSAVRIFKYKWQGMLQENMKNKQDRIHPTEKPIQLYKWLLTKYAEKGCKLGDMNGGSASISLACWDLGFDLDLCELDKDYFNDSWKRFDWHTRQQQLF